MPWMEWWPKMSAGGEAMTAAADSSVEAAADAAEAVHAPHDRR